jgi:hypothetical protein
MGANLSGCNFVHKKSHMFSKRTWAEVVALPDDGGNYWPKRRSECDE